MAYSLPPPPRLTSSLDQDDTTFLVDLAGNPNLYIHLPLFLGVCGAPTSSPTHIIACAGHLFEIFSRSRCSTRTLRQRGVRQPDESPGRAHLRNTSPQRPTVPENLSGELIKAIEAMSIEEPTSIARQE